MKVILGPESAPLSKLYWSVMTENENDSGCRISLIILVVRIQKFATGDSMSALSQLLLIRFWTKLKGSYPGSYLTIDKCKGDICPGEICPGNIYPSLSNIEINDIVWTKPQGQSPQICTARQCGTSTYEFFTKVFY